MHIQHRDPHTHKLSHGDREFTALRDGIFDVPAELGLELINHADWEPYVGEPAYEVTTTPAAATPQTSAAASEPAAEKVDWYAKGRASAEAGEAFATPDGLHPRSSEAREFKRGHDDRTKELAAARA